MATVIRPNAEPPVTSVAAGDIFLIDGATGVRALAATSVPLLDANLNLAVNSVIQGITSIATAAGTTVLLVNSTPTQLFTGVTTQTVTLPVVSTLALNQSFVIQNTSTGAITVNSSGGNLVTTVAAGATCTVKCILLTGTTAASWIAKYDAVLVATGKALTVSNSLTLAGTDGKTLTVSNSLTLAGTDATVMTFPSVSGTVATIAGTQTLTNKTYDTAGAGNVFKINGSGITTASGSGNTVVLTAGATLNNPVFTSPTLGVATATSLLANGAGGVGYATGAGGAVTQLTSRTTGVTLNTITGAITLVAGTGTVGTWVTMTVTNSQVAQNDTVVVSFESTGATNTYAAVVNGVANGSFKISQTNIAGTNSESPTINFAIIKGVNS